MQAPPILGPGQPQVPDPMIPPPITLASIESLLKPSQVWIPQNKKQIQFTLMGKGLKDYYFVKEFNQRTKLFSDKVLSMPVGQPQSPNKAKADSLKRAGDIMGKLASQLLDQGTKPVHNKRHLLREDIFNFASFTHVTVDKALLAGGIDPRLSQVTSDCVWYFAEEGMVEDLPKMHQPRYSHAAVYVEPSGLMVVGGRTFGEDPHCILDSCEFFEFHSKTWRRLPVEFGLT